MLKIKLLTIGKTKESWLEDALAEYLKRLKPVLSFELVLAKNDAELVELAQKEKICICLDPSGKLLSSEEFAEYFFSEVERGGSKLTFVIGGPEGLPQAMLKKHELLSLSRLTFTHQICRLILIEQIYRAVEMQKGSKYHK